jgi:transposase-like protein
MAGSKIVCPYCGHLNIRTEEHERDMHDVGKACFCCEGCGKLFTLQDDGCGEFVSS